MIKFFRKIRQQLLSENKFTKYLIYAIGEIILVVIGILLAVSINEWNSNRKAQQEIDHLLVAFQKDLTVNIKEGNRILDWAIRRDSIIELILQRKVTAEMYYERTVKPMFWNYNTADVITENLDKLLDKEAQLKIEAEPLLKLLKKYSVQLDRVAEQADDFANNSMENSRYLRDNMPWYNAYMDSTSMEAAIYFSEDDIYLNRTQFYQTLVNHNYGRALAGRQNIELILLYHLLKLQNKQSKVHEVFAELGFSPMTKTSCATTVELKESKKHYIPLIVNVGSNPVHVKFEYTHKGILETVHIPLGPGEYETYSGFYPFVVQIIEEDSCVAKYLPSAHSYLILGEE
ncbi:MAG: DUF6090 family protein [Flavobacteriales bacterium]